MTATTQVEGLVAPGFEGVRAEFERNFAERGEIGAAVAAYWRGEKVVDLWGGRRAPTGDTPFGSSPRAFGAPGAGGSFAFADPDARLGYAYVMNKMDFYLTDDPREKPLREALYSAIARLADRDRAATAVASPKMMAV